MQLNVLAVGEVRGVAGEQPGDFADDAQLFGGQCPSIDADPEHEVLVLELFRRQRGGSAAVDAGCALGVEPPPAEAASPIGRVDAGDTGMAVHLLDPLAHVEAVIVLFDLLVHIERLAVALGPLPLGARGLRPGRAVLGVVIGAPPKLCVQTVA